MKYNIMENIYQPKTVDMGNLNPCVLRLIAVTELSTSSTFIVVNLLQRLRPPSCKNSAWCRNHNF